MHYARIEESVVMETCDTDEDITTLYPPELVWVACGPEVAERWTYDGATFSPPAAPALDPDWRNKTWDEFRPKRDLYLSRLSDIAGRYQRKGIASVPPAADAIAEGLLAMPEDPAFLAAKTPGDLMTAVVVAANVLLRAQLTNAQTAPIIKAALDKVFK